MKLRPQEIRILWMLLGARGNIVSHADLLAEIGSKGGRGLLKVAICHIRRERPDLQITAHYGRGYSLTSRSFVSPAEAAK